MISPVAPREAAVEAAAQSRLDSAVSAYLQHAGLTFLASSSQEAVCESASQWSNATLEIDVELDGVGCPSVAEPPSPLASTFVSLGLPGRAVVVEAWLARQ
jgi:hypothetical protein